MHILIFFVAMFQLHHYVSGRLMLGKEMVLSLSLRSQCLVAPQEYQELPLYFFMIEIYCIQ